MYFAVIRFEPFNSGSRLVGRIKLAVPADVWLLLPPTVRTMTGPATRRHDTAEERQAARWADAMGNAQGRL